MNASTLKPEPVLRCLAGSWSLIGIAGIATLTSSSVYSSIAPWAALSIFLLLVVIGGFGAAGKFWARVCLLLPVFVVFLYAADVCYAYIAHARFTAYFWEMLAVAMWGLITGLVTLLSSIRTQSRQAAGGVPPKLK